MDTQREFDSEFCKVSYVKKDHIVLLTWKKFCSFDNYRKPTTFALYLLQQYSGSNFVVDARHGFEDEKEDITWGFTFLLPEISKTNCKHVVFIMDTVNELEEEMDLWTKEFMKYFITNKVTSYDEAVKQIHLSPSHMV